jgi:gluconate:H+ symporter, GntP family
MMSVNPAIGIFIAIAALIVAIIYFKQNTFISLFVVSIGLGLMLAFDVNTIFTTLKSGFGHTLEKIGLLIIFGVILGDILEKSGATTNMAAYIIDRVGEKKSPLAICLIGFLVGIPIFCDSGFIILSGFLFTLRSEKTRLPLILCLAGSLYAVHCLVPPHPGILAATVSLNADLGKTMILGVLIAIVPTIIVYFYALRFESPFINSNIGKIKTNENISTFSAFLPIWLPIFLMGAKAILASIFHLDTTVMGKVLLFIGEPIMALFIGILVALPLIRKSNFSELVNSSFSKSGHILAIVAAGGMFGEMVKLSLQKVPLDSYIGPLGIFWVFIPFSLAAFFKTAQGSSTVAAISAVSILKPMLSLLEISTDYKTQLFLMAIGAGSMVVSHANDAYFWVVNNFSKINQQQTLKYYSPMSALMALSSIFIIWVLSLWA